AQDQARQRAVGEGAGGVADLLPVVVLLVDIRAQPSGGQRLAAGTARALGVAAVVRPVSVRVDELNSGYRTKKVAPGLAGVEEASEGGQPDHSEKSKGQGDGIGVDEQEPQGEHDGQKAPGD